MILIPTTRRWRGLRSAAALCLMIAATEVRAQLYEVTDLGIFPGRRMAWPAAISNTGRVVGLMLSRESADQHGFLWRHGVLADLGTLGGKSSAALGINSTDLTVGISAVNAEQFEAFVSRNGEMSALDTLGGNYAAALDISTDGLIVGQAQTAAGITHATIWSPKGRRWRILDLDPGGPGHSSARAVNDLGQIVGTRNHRPVMWQDEHVIELADGGGSGWAVDINEHGEIIGHWYADPAPPHIGMFIWRDGEMRSLGSFTGYWEYANAINNHGQVVGEAEVSATAGIRGFIWERGVLTDLNTLLRPGSRWLIIAAYDINDSGQIVGVGHRDGLRHRAVLLTPVAYEADPSADVGDAGIWIGDTDKSGP